MPRLRSSRTARRMESQNLQNNAEETSEASEISEENQIPKGNTRKVSSEGKLMLKAALQGDWVTAEMLLNRNENLAYSPITREGDTALHIAAATNRTKFVRKLLERIGADCSLSVNDSGYTAFSYVVASGMVDIAALLLETNPNLGNIRHRDGTSPLQMAVFFGNRDLVLYIKEKSRIDESNFSKHELLDLFLDTIRNGMYDVALKILGNNRFLATMEGDEGTALHALSQHKLSDIRARREAILQRFVTMFGAVPCLSWLTRICERPLMRKKAWLLAEKLWQGIQTPEQAEIFDQRINECPILHEAAKAGNIELITMLTRADPDLIWQRDPVNEYTLFHIAVKERQEGVIRLMHQIGAVKYLIAVSRDVNGNNILHLAGEQAPSNRLTIVSGAALQMQRELMWFEEMQKLLPSVCLKMKNNAGLRPRELFSESHKGLLKEGETWMRETADSCMLIATIMLTVAFTGAFTVPGGNSSDSGIPILLKRSWFEVFVAADVVAMFCSTFSMTMFSSILTSRFQEQDFLVSLPRKLLFGVAGLFGSIVGAITAFISAYLLMFSVKENAWIPTLLGYFACFLLTLVFLSQHIRLIFDIMRLTFRYGYLFRSSKQSLY